MGGMEEKVGGEGEIIFLGEGGYKQIFCREMRF